MNNLNFAKGVAIIYGNTPDDKKRSSDVCATHDQLYFGDEEWITDDELIKELDELGWFINEGGWSCFT